MSFSNLKTGSLVKGRYQISAELGEGGFAKVFKAEDIELKRVVALKVVKMPLGGSTTDAERFRREARILAQLRHQNIVTVYSIDLLEDGSPFIVMEYLSGKSLQRFLLEKTALDYSTCREIFSQVCAGLSYAHESGAIHRDLSPANIFLVDDSPAKIKIIDFGLARLVADGETGNLTLTQTGAIVGNPAYMSPEQSRGEKLDERADIYSLGCVIYESICGKPPFECWNPIGLMQLQQNEYPPAPVVDWNNRALASKYSDLTLKCMQKDKSKRFQNCDELRDLLLEDTVGDLLLGNADPWRGTLRTRRRDARYLLIPALIIVAIAMAFSYGPHCVSSFLKSSRSDSLIGLKEWMARQLAGRTPAEASLLYEDLLTSETIRNDCARFRSICLDQAECRRRAGKVSSVIELLDSATSCTAGAQQDDDSFLKRANNLLDAVVDNSAVPTDAEMRLRARLLDKALKIKKKSLTKLSFDSLVRRTSFLIPQMYLSASPQNKETLSDILSVVCATLRAYPQLCQVDSIVWQLQGVISYTVIAGPSLSKLGAELDRILLSNVNDPKLRGELKLLLVDNLRALEPEKAYFELQHYLKTDSELNSVHRFSMYVKAGELAADMGRTADAVRNFTEAENLYKQEQFPSITGFCAGVGLYCSEWDSYQFSPETRKHCLKELYALLAKTGELDSPIAVLSLDRTTRKMKTGNSALEDQRTHAAFCQASGVFISAREFDKANAFLDVYLKMLRVAGVELQNKELLEKMKNDGALPTRTRELIDDILAFTK